MHLLQKYAWVLLFIVGIALLYYAYDNIVTIPSLAVDDPERGWDWLTRDPEVIDYIKFWFQNFGVWVLALAVLVMVIAATGYRQGQKWAWFSMLYLPVHVALNMMIWPWTLRILLVAMVIILLALVLPFRRFFPRTA